jgi:hypothetical protein
MAEHWPELAAAGFASKSTWQPDEIVKRALGVSEAENVKAQLNRDLPSSTKSDFRNVNKILKKNKHVMWYRLNLPADRRACVIINFRARLIVVHSFFISSHSTTEKEYTPKERLVKEICSLHSHANLPL